MSRLWGSRFIMQRFADCSGCCRMEIVIVMICKSCGKQWSVQQPHCTIIKTSHTFVTTEIRSNVQIPTASCTACSTGALRKNVCDHAVPLPQCSGTDDDPKQAAASSSQAGVGRRFMLLCCPCEPPPAWTSVDQLHSRNRRNAFPKLLSNGDSDCHDLGRWACETT